MGARSWYSTYTLITTHMAWSTNSHGVSPKKKTKKTKKTKKRVAAKKAMLAARAAKKKRK